MKNLFKTLSFIFAISIALVACKDDECDKVNCLNGGTCDNGTCQCPSGYSGEFCQNEEEAEFGFSPQYNETECVFQGEAYSQTVTLRNFTEISFSGQTIQVDTLRIDSLGNLPSGISYEFNKPSRTYLAGETGTIDFAGTTNDPVGDYEVDVYVYVVVSVEGSPLKLQDKVSKIINDFGVTGFDLEYYLRVRASGEACTNVGE